MLQSLAFASPAGYASRESLDGTTTGSRDEVDASIVDLSHEDGEFSPGEELAVEVVVKNTGTVSHTFSVGVAAIGPEGRYYGNENESWKTVVSIDPGETVLVSVPLTIGNAFRNGEYDIRSTIWKESDVDDLKTALDNALRREAFSVESSAENHTEESSDVVVVVEKVTETVYRTRSRSGRGTTPEQSGATPWTIIQTFTAVIGVGIALLEYRRRSTNSEE